MPSTPLTRSRSRRNPRRRIRYAVVGLGYISQAAVLPAFRHARKNSELAALVSDVRNGQDVVILGSPWAILLGIVYNYLPLMVFPLYVTLERLDPTLLEASKDLGAGRWATFRQITLPISSAGLITGSILVFIPLMGEYVIPSILGLGKIFLIGNVLQLDFLGSRNWPAGSAKAVVLIAIMLISVTFYVWTTTRGRGGRDVSVL